MMYEEAARYKMPFGLHQGETLGEILESDPGYMRWMAEEDIQFHVEMK